MRYLKMVEKTFNLINNFWTEFEEVKKSISHVGGFDGFCQCESEKVIEKTPNPTEARSFLILGMLIDQAVYGLSSQANRSIYEDFRSVYTYPKLVAHFDGSECSSAWFCYPNHGYDRKVDWLNVEKVSKVLFSESKDWLLENYEPFIHEKVRTYMLEDIMSHFREKPERENLLSLVEKYF